MRHLAPTVTCLMMLSAAPLSAQTDPPPAGPTEEVLTEEAPRPEEPVAMPIPEPPTPAPAAESEPLPPARTDEPGPPPNWTTAALPPPTEMAQPVEAEPVGEGARIFISVQTNATIGDLTEESAGFAFERATLTGVPDAVLGVRLDRLTLALGGTWSQISTENPQNNPCTGAPESFADTRTLFGLLPSVRYDFLTTSDGRGRMDGGVTVPLLLASRAREVATFDCPGEGRDVNDTADGVYGINAHIGGRYHIWDALTLGLEVGLSYLVFDQDENPDTPMEEPTVTTLTLYSGINLALELPL